MTVDGSRAIDVIDAEAGGDVSRVIVAGVAAPPGATMLARMHWLRRHADGLRRLLLYPPHGEPSMSANLVVPAVDARAERGFIIMEAMGYPPFSGSNALCTAVVLLESGILPYPRRGPELVLESPAGSYPLSIEGDGDRVGSIRYRAPAAFISHPDQVVVVPGHGRIRYDVVHGGVFYALVDARQFGLDPAHSPRAQLAAAGGALVEAARGSLSLSHPEYGPAGSLSFALFVDTERSPVSAAALPIAAYVHPGVICHSPSGTGTSALLAWLAARGRIAPGAQLRTVSPEGGVFEGRYLSAGRCGRYHAVWTEIRGWPRVLGPARIVLDPGHALLGEAGRGLLGEPG